MEIEKLLKIEAENEIEKLVMILSNNTDYGHPNGAMISVKQFYKCADHIMLWHEMQVNKLKQADVSGTSSLHHCGNELTEKEVFYDHCLKCSEYLSED